MSKYYCYELKFYFHFDKKPTEREILDLTDKVGELIDNNITEDWAASGSLEERESE